MIHSTGKLIPTAEIKKFVKQRADNSFTSTLDEKLFGNLPNTKSLPNIEDIDSAIALKMKNVEPHTDTWVGSGNPKKYTSIFWLVSIPKNNYLYIQIGDRAVKMYAGYFVEFDDTVLHSVQSSHTWYGIAYQVAQNN